MGVGIVAQMDYQAGVQLKQVKVLMLKHQINRE
jgi:hypothetical protein